MVAAAVAGAVREEMAVEGAAREEVAEEGAAEGAEVSPG